VREAQQVRDALPFREGQHADRGPRACRRGGGADDAPIPCHSWFTLSVHRQARPLRWCSHRRTATGHHSVRWLPATPNILACRSAQNCLHRNMLRPLQALVAALLASCSSGLQQTRLGPGAGTVGESGKSRPLKGRFLHITGQPRRNICDCRSSSIPTRTTRRTRAPRRTQPATANMAPRATTAPRRRHATRPCRLSTRPWTGSNTM
jgi:hypothetical protein